MITIDYSGERYNWDGKLWCDIKGIVPPTSIAHHLNRLLESKLSSEDDQLRDPNQLMDRARIAIAAGQTARATRLTQRALYIAPRHEGIAAAAVSILRKAHRSDQALSVLEPFRKTRYVPLLVTGAAVLCDVNRWEDALVVIRRALALQDSGEAFAVFRRIKKNRPDLFPE